MKTILKIAWRNIWRNKRRTLITVASIMFALFFAIIMRGFQKGSYAKMKENAVESYSGYLQIQNKDYWDDKTINNTMTFSQEMAFELAKDERVKVIIPRLESFSLASSGVSTKGVVVMGIDPDKEDKMTKVKSYLQSGEFIEQDDKSIMLSQGLAQFLDIGVNDTLVLFSSGYHGTTAAGLYPVKGILKLPTPEMNRSTVYLPILEAQDLFSAYDRYSALVFDLYDMNDVKAVEDKLRYKIDTNEYRVMGWEAMNKELLQMIETDNAGGVIMIAILYMVIAFGIFGTVLMMTNERIREFSVMVSVGMQKRKLALVVIVELFFLTGLAVAAGVVISLPVMYYFLYNPIEFSGDAVEVMLDFNFEPVMPMSMDWSIFVFQGIAISILSLIAMSYPTIKILKLDVVKGLRS
ncbi:ABC transporter permease [Lutimonas vermicola]|uniref:FtsX-like permease family protein n=1 Tax=Lutimonas vermicola TaxID=414288 RepID=A0ABU9L2Y9_9FLAO